MSSPKPTNQSLANKQLGTAPYLPHTVMSTEARFLLDELVQRATKAGFDMQDPKCPVWSFYDPYKFASWARRLDRKRYVMAIDDTTRKIHQQRKQGAVQDPGLFFSFYDVTRRGAERIEASAIDFVRYPEVTHTPSSPFEVDPRRTYELLIRFFPLPFSATEELKVIEICRSFKFYYVEAETKADLWNSDADKTPGILYHRLHKSKQLREQQRERELALDLKSAEYLAEALLEEQRAQRGEKIQHEFPSETLSEWQRERGLAEILRGGPSTEGLNALAEAVRTESNEERRNKLADEWFTKHAAAEAAAARAAAKYEDDRKAWAMTPAEEARAEVEVAAAKARLKGTGAKL